MKNKKIIIFVLSLVIGTSFFIYNYFSKVNRSGNRNLMQFTLFVGDSNAKPIDISATPVGKKVTEITGVKLKTDYLVGSDEKTKSSLMIASGEYPDLLAPHNEYGTYRDAKALVPLDDYIEKYGQNIKRIYGNRLEMMRDQKDGKIYSLSPYMEVSTPLYPSAGFWFPNDVLKKYGYPKNITFEKYFDIIEDYIKRNPTIDGKSTIGFTAVTDDWRMYILLNAPVYLAGYPNTGPVYIDENYVAHSFQLNDWSYKYFKKLNEFWNKGLIDKDMFTQSYEEYKGKIASGRVIGFFDERWQIEDALETLEKQGMYDKVPVALPVLYEGVKKDSYNGFNNMGTSPGVCITKSCNDPVAAFKFLDEMASDEIQKLNNWGIEGEDYFLKDGKMCKNPEQIEKTSDQNYLLKQGINSIWIFPHSPAGKDSKYADGNYVSFYDTDDYLNSRYKDYEKEILKVYNVKNLSDMMAPAVKSKYGNGWDITIPDSEQDVKITEQKSSEIQRKYVANLIMCKNSEYDRIWASYKEEMINIKYDIGDAYRTKEIQRRVKEWSK